MSLLEKLAVPPTRKNVQNQCLIGALVARIRVVSPNEALALENALLPAVTSGWGAKALEKVLREEGHNISNYTISKHRSRTCNCFNQAAGVNN